MYLKLVRQIRCVSPMSAARSVTSRFVGDPHSFPGFSVNVVLLRPKSRGFIELNSPNPNDAPTIGFNFMSAPGDRDAIVAGLKTVRGICAAPAMHRFSPEELVPGKAADSDEALAAE